MVGCGSQNLGPLEDKTTNLRDENHNLKLKIQQLNQDINNQKSQLILGALFWLAVALKI